MAEPPRLMTLKEVCDYFRQDRVTIWRWVKSGKLRNVSLDGHPLFDPRDVEALSGRRDAA